MRRPGLVVGLVRTAKRMCEDCLFRFCHVDGSRAVRTTAPCVGTFGGSVSELARFCYASSRSMVLNARCIIFCGTSDRLVHWLMRYEVQGGLHVRVNTRSISL
ncbi:unnamed protein product, partial [Sphacelaria rigidula]